MRRFLSVVVLLALCLCLVGGCGGKSGNGKKPVSKSIKIGISIYNQYDTFVGELMNEVLNIVKEKEKEEDIVITLEVANAGASQVTQNAQVENFAKNGCDIICVNLVDRTDASTVIGTGKSSSVPIIFFNRELVQEDLEQWDQLYYVGAEAFQSGDIQGDILVNLCQQNFGSVDKNRDGVLQYVMLEGEAGHQDSIVRSLSVINRIRDNGIQVEKLADEIANWNKDQAYTKMSQWLDTMKGEIEVCISNNDDMALGAAAALKDAGYTPGTEEWPVILGIDGTEPGVEAVKKGELAGTVVNDSKGQARGMVELACKIVLGTELPETVKVIDGKYIRLPYEEFTGEVEE